MIVARVDVRVDVEVDPAALAHVHQRGAAPDRVGARRLGRAVPAAALRAQPLVERRLLVRLARVGEHAVARLQRLLALFVQPLADGFGAAAARRPLPLGSVRPELLELLLLGGAFGARGARAHVLDARRVRVQPRARALLAMRASRDARARARAAARARRRADGRGGGARDPAHDRLAALEPVVHRLAVGVGLRGARGARGRCGAGSEAPRAQPRALVVDLRLDLSGELVAEAGVERVRLHEGLRERARLVVLVHVYLLDRVVRELDLDDEKQRRHS